MRGQHERAAGPHTARLLVIGWALAPVAAWAAPPVAKGPAPAPAASVVAALPPEAAVERVKALATALDSVVRNAADLQRMRADIGRELDAVVDHHEMARRSLPAEVWQARSPAERAEYTALLRKMFDRSYVDRFRPGKRVEVVVEPKPRVGKEGRVQVRTRLTVDGTRSHVAYSLHVVGGAYKLYDVVVDDTSQLSTWRKSFQKIMQAEGWKGLIARLKKGTDR